jgi:ABC-2 type transport system permease protein
MGALTPIGVMILTQSSIVREKQSGTAEWVLSAPLSREAFVLSKLVANSFWILAILVVLQGMAFELILMAFGVGIVPVLNLLGGLALHGLHLLFWVTLSLMLGSFFGGRGPVVGIPLVLFSFQELIVELAAKYVPWIGLLFPQRLTELAALVVTGEPMYSTIPLLTMTAWMILFTLAAIWKFKREEF